MKSTSQFLIAAPTSGSGKTTVCRGLMALLSSKNMKVQPFKCGPDYIDTKFHEQVCHAPSYNLDTFMASEAHVRMLYATHAAKADVCIVEGMMGMYDGYDRYLGSSGQIAKVLNIPVVLVINAKSAAYSAAVLAKGFIDFDPEVRVAGVIFNYVSGDRHEAILRKACADIGITCFGCLRNDVTLEVTSRYLGLNIKEASPGEQPSDILSGCEQHIDYELLLEKTRCELPVETLEYPQQGSLNIWVARSSEAFAFMYAEHMDILKSMGEVTFFNPEDEDVELPSDVDLLYLPGGYPECRVPALVKAEKIRRSIKEYIEKGGRTLAECGGMMYLASAIITEDGDEESSQMVGVLPVVVSNEKEKRRLSLGYRRFKMAGMELRGHEFHYTQMISKESGFDSVAQVYNAQGIPVDTPVFRYKNVIAGYTHLYWGETDVIRLFVN